jgi:hypothetical protein
MKLSSQKFYSFLYILCIVVSFFPNYELTFIVWLFTILVSLKSKYSITIVRFTMVFSTIVLIALVTTFFYSSLFFNAVKDFTYLLKPILGILVGYQLHDKVSKKAFNTFILAGITLATIHIGLILFALLQFHTVDMNLIRAEAGFFSDYEVYVLVVLLFYKKLNIEIIKSKRIFFISILSFSIFMYLSRTNFLQLAILIMGLKGYFILSLKSIRVILITSLVILLGYSSVYYSNPKRNGKGLEGLLYKIKIAPVEAFKTKINTEDWKDFNDNYRSYENILTIREIKKDGASSILFGKGLGSTMNIGQKIYTTDGSVIQHISIAHNGFMTILLKSGVVGLFFLIITIVLLYNQKKSDDYLVNNINLLLIGTSVFLILSYWVFMGLYFKLDNKSIIIGFLIAMRESLIKQNHLLKREQT